MRLDTTGFLSIFSSEIQVVVYHLRPLLIWHQCRLFSGTESRPADGSQLGNSLGGQEVRTFKLKRYGIGLDTADPR